MIELHRRINYRPSEPDMSLIRMTADIAAMAEEKQVQVRFTFGGVTSIAFPGQLSTEIKQAWEWRRQRQTIATLGEKHPEVIEEALQRLKKLGSKALNWSGRTLDAEVAMAFNLVPPQFTHLAKEAPGQSIWSTLKVEGPVFCTDEQTSQDHWSPPRFHESLDAIASLLPRPERPSMLPTNHAEALYAVTQKAIGLLEEKLELIRSRETQGPKP